MCVSLNPKQQEPQGVLLTSLPILKSDPIGILLKPSLLVFVNPINGSTVMKKKSLSAWAWSIKNHESTYKAWFLKNMSMSKSPATKQNQVESNKSCESRHLFYLWRSFHSFQHIKGALQDGGIFVLPKYPLVNSQNIFFFYLSSELQNVCRDITIHKM